MSAAPQSSQDRARLEERVERVAREGYERTRQSMGLARTWEQLSDEERRANKHIARVIITGEGEIEL